MWPESTGGQTGANIEIAGFPGGGDAPFNTVQLMGSPLYGMPTLSFFEQTSHLPPRRHDRARSRSCRAARRWCSPTARSAPARTSSSSRAPRSRPGSLGVTYGDENLRRVDGFYGFPIAKNWYGSVGGFYRDSDGVRDPQFPADKGGQLTATLTHEFDTGR